MNNLDINKLIATKVMEWSIKTTTDGQTEYYDNGSFCDGKWVEDIGIIEKDNLDVFKPTERIKDAWEVVERFEFAKFEYEKDYACVEFWEDEVMVGFANDESIPMAICKAALKSVGIKI